VDKKSVRSLTNYTWSDFDRDILILCKVLHEKGITEKVSAIYGIPRGGLVLGVVLSHKLDKPLYTTISEVLVASTHGARVLIVDDISDTGSTLYQTVCHVGCFTCTLHYVRTSIFEPDVWINEKKNDQWVVYPWEVKGGKHE